MSQQNLVMPKADGRVDVCNAVLKFFSNYDYPISQEIYKKHIGPPLAEFSKSMDSLQHVKKMEMPRYFGLLGQNKQGFFITDRGKKFLQASNSQGKTEVIFEALKNDTFGKDNNGVPSSSSEIQPPLVFLKALLDIGSITRKQYACLIYLMHDKGLSYPDAIAYIQNNVKVSRILDDMEEDGLEKKYNDIKFIGFFHNLGIITEKARKYQLSASTLGFYSDVIKSFNEYAIEKPVDDQDEDNDDSPLLGLDPSQFSLVKVSPPSRPNGGNKPSNQGKRTTTPRKRDYEKTNKRNKEKGDFGEAVVLNAERTKLIQQGYPKLADEVEAVFEVDDSAGFDIKSFEIIGNVIIEKYLEVKTTLDEDIDFDISASEVKNSRHLHDGINKKYVIVRVFNVNKKDNTCQYYEIEGPVEDNFNLTPTSFKASRKE
ncbi:DUF3883 domain-containing protein [Bacillus luteolus]|uniref:DUF3883 domain-containing protein n=1 Tax=Litchfieldia luteola TaxID=682179 RepID=A0ABR9QHC2_9BACI|nr:DUF3883 domain-containing protein [Cytobacillus luteolus]MBE4907881.1 DUF3883 domain-containing protein [Cytobacillus luteolus]MBP1943961.1 hypothetical protein [Cytobacillus luteolus]